MWFRFRMNEIFNSNSLLRWFDSSCRSLGMSWLIAISIFRSFSYPRPLSTLCCLLTLFSMLYRQLSLAIVLGSIGVLLCDFKLLMWEQGSQAWEQLGLSSSRLRPLIKLSKLLSFKFHVRFTTVEILDLLIPQHDKYLDCISAHSEASERESANDNKVSPSRQREHFWFGQGICKHNWIKLRICLMSLWSCRDDASQRGGQG